MYGAVNEDDDIVNANSHCLVEAHIHIILRYI